MYESLFAKIGELITVGGGAAAVTYAMYVFLGKTWLKNEFDKQLEDHKALNMQFLENFKHKIARELDRTSKVYELELQVLPEAWARLHRTYENLAIFVSPAKYEHDVVGMSDEKYKKYMSLSGFEVTDEILNWKGRERIEGYRDLRWRYEYAEVSVSFKEFHEYIEEKSVFLSADIRDEFRAIDNEIWDAIDGQLYSNQVPDSEYGTASFKSLREKIQPKRDRLEVLIQNRLRLISVED